MTQQPHECDCGARYSSFKALDACQASNHGRGHSTNNIETLMSEACDKMHELQEENARLKRDIKDLQKALTEAQMKSDI